MRYRTTLGDFLRARRSTCQPEDVGIDRDTSRRVPGLRRDEVARLAGMSAEYYVRLEQGRVSTPSRQVIDALARAMRLDHHAADYMARLARGEGAFGAHADEFREQARTYQRLEGILQQWSATPAYLTDSNLDIIAANDLMVTLTGGTIAAGKNVVQATFVHESRAALLEWEHTARAAVATLRYTADEDAPRFRQLVATLATDRDFDRIWHRYEVLCPGDYEVEADSDFGVIRFGIRNFVLPDLRGCMVTVWHAAEGSAAADSFTQLRINRSTAADRNLLAAAS